MGTGGITLPFFTSAVDGGEWLASRPSRYAPAERALVPTAQEGACASEAVWTLWRGEKSLSSAGNRTPAVQPIAIPSELFRLVYLPKLSYFNIVSLWTQCTQSLFSFFLEYASLRYIMNSELKAIGLYASENFFYEGLVLDHRKKISIGPIHIYRSRLTGSQLKRNNIKHIKMCSL
jgi:hypothetical protein